MNKEAKAWNLPVPTGETRVRMRGWGMEKTVPFSW